MTSPYVLLSLASLFWSFNFIIGKILSGAVPPVTISFFRWLLPFFVFLPLYWQEIRSNLGLLRDKWPRILFLGATGYCLNSISVYEAVRYTTTINASFVNAFNPVLIALIGYVLYQEQLTRRQFAGFIFSLAGVLCIIFRGSLQALWGLEINTGDLFMVGSISFWSIHTTAYKKMSSGFHYGAVFTLMMLAGLLITLPMLILENLAGGWDWLDRVSGVHVLGIFGLNIFPSVLAYQFWTGALQRIPANKVGIFLYLVPVYTTVISILFLNESLELFHIIGGLLIFIGILMVTYVRTGKEHSEPYPGAE